jgi:soluble lytic murein transglycosylase-like protein
MIDGPRLLFFAAFCAVFAGSPAHAEVFELRSDGALVNITQPLWQAQPVAADLPAPDQPILGAPPAAPVPRSAVQQHIAQAAHRYGIHAPLLDAVAWQESRYNPRAVSTAGAIGVMQLMPGTARMLGVSDPRNVAQNVAGGAAYLRQQLEKFGNNVPLALAAYNAGPGAVLRHGGIPPYRETRNYVQQIINRLARTSALTVSQ